MREAFELLDADNHCELLQYTATDASADGAARLADRIAKPSFQAKVRGLCLIRPRRPILLWPGQATQIKCACALWC